MRNLYKKDGIVFEFEENQKHLIDSSFVKMVSNEIDQHINPEKYLSDEERLLIYRQNMPDLSRIEFKYKLHKAGKLEEVEQSIKTTDNFLLQLAYNEAQFFSRTDPLLSQAMVDLGWTEAQVDEIWTS